MTQLSQATSPTPAALAGVPEDTAHELQNRGCEAVLYEVAPDAPTNTDDAFLLPPGAVRIFGVAAGESCWVWSPAGDSRVAYGTT